MKCYIYSMLGLVLCDISGVCDLRPRMHTSRAWLESVLTFKNLPYTIAERHQNYMCLHLLSPPGNNSLIQLSVQRRRDWKWYTKCFIVFIDIVHVHVFYHIILSYLVTCTPCDDASLTPEAREVITQSFPSSDLLPR